MREAGGKEEITHVFAGHSGRDRLARDCAGLSRESSRGLGHPKLAVFVDQFSRRRVDPVLALLGLDQPEGNALSAQTPLVKADLLPFSAEMTGRSLLAKSE